MHLLAVLQELQDHAGKERASPGVTFPNILNAAAGTDLI